MYGCRFISVLNQAFRFMVDINFIPATENTFVIATLTYLSTYSEEVKKLEEQIEYIGFTGSIIREIRSTHSKV